ETMAQAAAQVEALRNRFRDPSQAGGEWAEFAAALDDDFNTPDALAVMHGWRDHALLLRALDLFGLGSLGEQAEAPPQVLELADRRHAARAARDFEGADRLRAEIEARGWRVRDVADGFQLVPGGRASSSTGGEPYAKRVVGRARGSSSMRARGRPPPAHRLARRPGPPSH